MLRYAPASDSCGSDWSNMARLERCTYLTLILPVDRDVLRVVGKAAGGRPSFWLLLVL